jgi:hypothetical protein
MPGYPLQPQAEQLAQAGRYGDTMLMHVNPAEVQGLASIMPLTTNPETGQPEAFLPFLIPLLGSILGTTALPAALSGVGATGLGGFLAASPGIAGAIGSGAAEWARTGDFKQGLMSGLTGYGTGAALKGLGQAATKETLTKKVTEALGDKVTEGTAERLASDAMKRKVVTDPTFGDLPWGKVQNQSLIDQGIPWLEQADLAGDLMGIARRGFDATRGGWAKEGLRRGIGNPSQLLAAVQEPGAMLPLVGGMGMSSAEESRRLWEEEMAQFDAEEEERKRRYEAESPELIPISNPYSRRYGLQGGIIG